MSVTQDEVRALVGTRVKVKFGGEQKFLTLRAFTPKEVLILADQRGDELLLPFDDLKLLEDARIECRECGTLVNIVHGGEAQRCADCERGWAALQPTPREVCEGCGALGAFYSPRAKRFACAQCHAKQGTLTGIGAEARVLKMHESECKGTDTNDSLHRWFHIRGHRWHCKACGARRFNDPPLGTIYHEPR